MNLLAFGGGGGNIFVGEVFQRHGNSSVVSIAPFAC